MKRLLLILFLFSQLTAAEYRAFELVITDKGSGKERVVISTLDPGQYRGYYPVAYSENVTYRGTWRCKGNTSNFKPVCPKPEGKPSGNLDRK